MPEEQPQWKFVDEDSDGSQNQSSKGSSHPISEVSWTASEFIAHSKTAGWYALLALGLAVITGVSYLVTMQILPTAIVLIMGIIIAGLAGKQPDEKTYVVDSAGLKIGEKLYPYSTFRSFSIVQEEGVESIWFAPLKRFMPSLNIYFDPSDGDKIVDALAQYLPLENKKLDPVDKLIHRLRF